VHVSIEGGGVEHRDHWCGGMELLEAYVSGVSGKSYYILREYI